jgi:hypothetical protein
MDTIGAASLRHGFRALGLEDCAVMPPAPSLAAAG